MTQLDRDEVKIASLPADSVSQTASKKLKIRDLLGPGLITGASDDDPSGIATYSQAGAQFGYQLCWTMLFTFPLMCAIQEISARIGRVTGLGIAGNLRRYYPKAAVYPTVLLLVVANIINLGADLGAMAAAVKLFLPGPQYLYLIGFGVGSAILEIFTDYSRYIPVLRWLALSLLSYVATTLIVHVPWGEVALSLVIPHLSFNREILTVIVAVFGTTISPYLFFWQAGVEVEDEKEDPDARPLRRAPEQAPRELMRIRWDTLIGMFVSNLIALFIMLTAAATLNVHGITDINTSAEAATALEPIAGRFASVLFALGIIGTGLLALPTLAGSAAYALGETFGWRVGLARKLRAAKKFYSAIAVMFVAGILFNLVPLDPVKALFWSAVLNGVAAVPIMIMVMLIATRRKAMGEFTIKPMLKTLGWAATAAMAASAIGMFATW